MKHVHPQLNRSQIQDHERDGFLIPRDFSDANELDPSLGAYRGNTSDNGTTYGKVDEQDLPRQICIRAELDNGFTQAAKL